MKKIILIFVLIFSLNAVKAQNKNTDFGLELNSDAFSVTLSDLSLSSNTLGVSLYYCDNSKFVLRAGTHLSLLLSGLYDPTQPRVYNAMNFLNIGIGYYLDKNNDIEFYSIVYNSIYDFKKFSNYQIDLGVKVFFGKKFYIGGGLRYFKTTLNIGNNEPNNYNWFMQLGYKYNLSGIKK